MTKISKTKLASGLRLVTISRPDSLSATVMIMVKAGSLDEKKNISGLSHFIEHMCFKGTERWPDQLALATEFEKISARYNAFTSQEYTGYYATVVPKHLDRALELLSDMYLHPVFDGKEIERERGVIKEEIKRNHDLPSHHIYDLYQELCFGDTSAGRNIAGTEESVSAIKQQDFLDYREIFYTAPNTVIVISGKFDNQAVKEQVKKYFSKLSKRESPSRPKSRFTDEVVRLERRETNQSWLVMGWPGVDRFHKDFYVAGSLAKILGGGMVSRLWQKIREEMGAAYSIGAFHEGTADSGQFVISAGTSSSRAEEVIRAALSECQKIAREGVSADELKLAKDSAIGSLDLGLETSSDLADFYGFSELLRSEIVSPQEIKKKIEAVTTGDIKRLAKKIFHTKGLKLAILGPHDKKTSFVKTLEM